MHVLFVVVPAQQIVQQGEGELLEYVLIGESGPDHNKVFTVEARLNSNVIGKGSAHSKREAEQQAAKEALAARKDDYLRSYTNDAGLTFTYIEFTAVMTDYDAHRKFYNDHNVRTDEPEASTGTYRFRQYFLAKDGYIYLFTYTSTDASFSAYLTDAEKVVKYFEFK